MEITSWGIRPGHIWIDYYCRHTLYTLILIINSWKFCSQIILCMDIYSSSQYSWSPIATLSLHTIIVLSASPLEKEFHLKSDKSNLTVTLSPIGIWLTNKSCWKWGFAGCTLRLNNACRCFGTTRIMLGVCNLYGRECQVFWVLPVSQDILKQTSTAAWNHRNRTGTDACLTTNLDPVKAQTCKFLQKILALCHIHFYVLEKCIAMQVNTLLYRLKSGTK